MREPMVWRDGACMPWSSATVHACSDAVLLGATVSEFISVAFDAAAGDAVLFRLSEHLKHARRKAAMCAQTLPYDEATLRAAAEEVVAACGTALREQSESAAREAQASCAAPAGQGREGAALQTLGVVELRAIPKDAAEGLSVVLAFHAAQQRFEQAVRSQGVAACVSSWRIGFAQAMASQAASAAARLVEAAAAEEAQACGFDAALLLNDVGRVCSCSGGALFSVRDGVLATPPCADGACESVARDTVLNLAMDIDIPVIEESMTRVDALIADELFFVDDAEDIVRIASIGGHPLGQGASPAQRSQAKSRGKGSKKEASSCAWPVTEALSQRYDQARCGALPEYDDWTTRVRCK